MKIALCLSGHLRCGEELLPNLKKVLLNEYDTDIYIYLWGEKEVFDNLNNCYHQTHEKISNLFLKNTINKYSPKEIIVSNNINFLKNLLRFNLTESVVQYIDKNKHPIFEKYSFYSLLGFFSQHYGVYRSIQMALNSKISYDLIIRCRFDNYFKRTIIKDEMLLGKKYILIPNEMDFCGGWNDRFAIGNPKDMSVYSSLFCKIYKYCVIENIPYHPEFLLKLHLTRNNLCVQRIDPLAENIRFSKTVLHTSNKYDIEYSIK